MFVQRSAVGAVCDRAFFANSMEYEWETGGAFPSLRQSRKAQARQRAGV